MTLLPQLERDLLTAHARVASRRSRLRHWWLVRRASAADLRAAGSRGRARHWAVAGVRALPTVLVVALPLVIGGAFFVLVHARHRELSPAGIGRRNPAHASTSGAPSGWTGMGARLSAFRAAYPRVASEDGYGSAPGHPPGQCCEFHDVSTTGLAGDRVDGYTQAFSSGTGLAAAKLKVLALMPRDTVTTAFFIQDYAGTTCALWNVRSSTLGRWFARVGDAEGVMSIDLNTLNTQTAFSPNDVTEAAISTGPATHSSSCATF